MRQRVEAHGVAPTHRGQGNGVARVVPLASNRALGQLVGQLQVQRNEDAEAPAPQLNNTRFVSNPTLQRIVGGQISQLTARHNGTAVSLVQRALKDSGFDLPLHRVDGEFGAETESAIQEFREVHGPSSGDDLDGTTLLRLDAVAPAQGAITKHQLDYERLLADNRLDVTVAIGATDATVQQQRVDGGWDDTNTPVEEAEATAFRAWLTGHGFDLELLGFDGVQHWKSTRTFRYTNAEGATQTVEADVWVRLIVPASGAAEEFRHGMTNDEITIYSGHARYGSGPDFDAKGDPQENFRIGIDTALEAAGRRTRVDEARRHGVAIDEEHDLQEMVNSGDFDADRYRVLFLNACTSMAYLDELRSEVGGQENLDVIGTRKPSRFTTVSGKITTREIEIFLEGVLASTAVEDVITALDEQQATVYGNTVRQGLFTMSGIGDNPTAP